MDFMGDRLKVAFRLILVFIERGGLRDVFWTLRILVLHDLVNSVHNLILSLSPSILSFNPTLQLYRM